jgi:uncharacterized membrane protein
LPAAASPEKVEGEVRKVLESELHVTRAQAELVAPKLVKVTELLWQAPIPPPAILQQYDLTVPGAARKIIDAFTSEGEHRHSLEHRQMTYQMAGLAGGVLSVFGMLGLAAFALYVDQPYVAGAIPAFLATVAGVFIYRQPKNGKAQPPQAPQTRAEKRNAAKKWR